MKPFVKYDLPLSKQFSLCESTGESVHQNQSSLIKKFKSVETTLLWNNALWFV